MANRGLNFLSSTSCTIASALILLGCSSPHKVVQTISGEITLSQAQRQFSQAIDVELRPHAPIRQYVLGAVRGSDAASIDFDIQPDATTRTRYALHRNQPFTNGYAIECKEATTCQMRFVLTGEYRGASLASPIKVPWEASAWIEEQVAYPSTHPQSLVSVRAVP